MLGANTDLQGGSFNWQTARLKKVNIKSKISRIIGLLLLILIFVNSAMLLPTMINFKINQSNGVKKYIFAKPLVIYQNNFEQSFINKAKEFDLKYTIVK